MNGIRRTEADLRDAQKQSNSPEMRRALAKQRRQQEAVDQYNDAIDRRERELKRKQAAAKKAQWERTRPRVLIFNINKLVS